MDTHSTALSRSEYWMTANPCSLGVGEANRRLLSAAPSVRHSSECHPQAWSFGHPHQGTREETSQLPSGLCASAVSSKERQRQEKTTPQHGARIQADRHLPAEAQLGDRRKKKKQRDSHRVTTRDSASRSSIPMLQCHPLYPPGSTLPWKAEPRWHWRISSSRIFLEGTKQVLISTRNRADGRRFQWRTLFLSCPSTAMGKEGTSERKAAYRETSLHSYGCVLPHPAQILPHRSYQNPQRSDPSFEPEDTKVRGAAAEARQTSQVRKSVRFLLFL